jgi:hypothetical protein
MAVRGTQAVITGEIVVVNNDDNFNFKLVQNNQYEDRDGNVIQEATWFTIFLSEKQEETISKYINKGAVVQLTGGMIVPFTLPEEEEADNDDYDYKVQSSITIKFPMISILKFADSEDGQKSKRRSTSRRSSRRDDNDDNDDSDDEASRRSSGRKQRKSRKSRR